ncbi:hypothetical protein PVAND_013506 [Polypedilum vanderplanki]|uniref:HMG box domain-containing protein n=1 Tax=Polypedilum vanderplanki TaxID=319348 RepID=A0A9J6CRM0_POLVA|nr:hypothetical protein PVAND_013506 [Polypedilum vanderplanki]
MNNQPRIQKKNKKTKLSGFTLFIIEYNGRRVNDGEDTFMKRYEITKAAPKWKELSETRRQHYKDRANRLNVKIVNTYDRYNSIGEKLDEVEIRKRQEEEAKKNRRCEIEQMLKNAADLAELDNTVFYFLSTSKYFDEPNGKIFPAEFAIAKFSLSQGVFDTISFKINAGKLPVGSALEVEEISKKTHNYNIEDCNDPGEKDYFEIMIKIINFLHPFDEIPIFFTEGNDDIFVEKSILAETQKIMKRIFEEVLEFDAARKLKIYSIDELLFYLKNLNVEIEKEINPECQDEPFISIVDANANFRKVSNEYSFNTKGCEFHEKVDALQNCCLAKVRGYGYTIAKWCAINEKYELKPGKHFPESDRIVNDTLLKIYK